MKWVTCAAVLVAAWGLVLVPAQADDEVLKTLELMLRRKDPGKLVELLGKGFVEVGPDDVDTARKACAMLEDHARANALANDGDGTTSALIEWFEQMADKLIEENPKKPSSHRAKAHVLSARVKCEIAAVRFKGPGPWEECAKLCLKAAELSKTKKAQYIADAAQYYGDWYPHAGDRQAEVHQMALETAKQGLAANPDDPYLTAAVGQIYLNEAKGLVAAKKKGPAKKALQAAIDILQPKGELPRGKKGDKQAGAYNRVLAFADSNKIKVKGDYITNEKKSTEWQVTYPRGTGWKYTIGGGGNDVLSLRRDTEWGRCIISVQQYSWDVLYTTPDGNAGGDNTTGMMRQGENQLMGAFSKITTHKKKIKGKLNRQIKKTAGYDIRGLDEDDENQRIRGWYFKGAEHRKTYAIDVWWIGDAPDLDGEVEFILKKLVERKRKK